MPDLRSLSPHYVTFMPYVPSAVELLRVHANKGASFRSRGRAESIVWSRYDIQSSHSLPTRANSLHECS